ncbi:DUF6603 domain-containing protein [Lapillicoccus sp.]|uniref:DUF6603 domain-containing protein n=1 Tax=Lapillicoccus sp. TaxID=1909287 RepID=UPI0025D7FC9F|nr:DUF6603 domain-containing protein [Lapillicoccus sp.]
MTDVATGFLQAVSAFGATRLGRASSTTYHDSGSLLDSLGDGIPNTVKPAYDKLKADLSADADLVKPIKKAIDSQITLIGKMASESITDARTAAFTSAEAGRIAVRIGTALIAIDEAVTIVASELSKDQNGTVVPATREALLGIWNPWVQPFRDLADGAGKLLDSLGKQVLGIDGATKGLGDALTFDRATFRLAAKLTGTGERDFGVLRLDETSLEAFLGFNRVQFLNPTDAQKGDLVERDGTWWQADQAVFGVRLYVTIRPGLQGDPLLKAIMPGSSDPKPIKPTALTLDSANGFSLGDGQGAGNEKLVLPVQFNFPAVEIREVALGIVRNAQHEMSGLELTTIIAAKLGGAVGMQVGGAGATIALDGQPPGSAIFPMAVSPRWPDQIGLRIKAGPITGGGFLERRTRTYGTGASAVQLVEFGGVIQLEILKVGVYAIGILSPDPFSMVLVMGVHFPVAIELSFGFTFNGIGGILAINRRIDTTELVSGIRSHFVDSLLFPDDPVSAAPTLLDKLAKVFPPQPGGFVVGPIIELGWGSQAKIVEAKLGIVLALPDPKLIILGAVRVRAPSKMTPLTDLRCEVYGEISAEHLLIIASLRDSKIAGYTVSGDLGLLIQWGGGGAFALSVGGFHPRYTAIPPELQGLQRLTIDMSPPAILKIVIKAYFAVTAGAIMAGIRGDLNADVGVASAHAWLQLDMIFYWVPRFGFSVDLELGISIEVFGCSFAEIGLKGTLSGTTPWFVEGTATVDVWFLPTFHFHLGPISWGAAAVDAGPAVSPLALVAEALNDPDAWKAVMPLDGDLLVSLGNADASGLLAHPLSALEITQSRVPLETHLDRIGSSGVSAHRVNLGLARTSAGPAAAVSTVTAPFAPGQFLALEGEALLARSGFDDLPSGCRVSAATTPVFGDPVADRHEKNVTMLTYYRGDEAPLPRRFSPLLYAEVLVEHSLTGRSLAQRDNPYLPRTAKVNPHSGDKVSVLPAGSATVRAVDDNGLVLADLGVLGGTEAGWVADTVNAAGVGHLTAVSVGVI